MLMQSLGIGEPACMLESLKGDPPFHNKVLMSPIDLAQILLPFQNSLELPYSARKTAKSRTKTWM